MLLFDSLKKKAEEQVVTDAEKFKGELEAIVADDIAFQAGQFARDYQDLLPKIKKMYEDGVSNHLQTFKNELDKILVESTRSVKEQLNSFQTSIQEQSKKQLETIDQDIQAYKNKKINEIDEKVKKIVKDAVFEILGKTLTLSEHEELIRQAIAQASREIHL